MLHFFILRIILLFYFLFSTLHAKEPIMALLVSIPANDIQTMNIAQNSFVCEPYGVVSIEELYRDTITNEVCKESIEKLYKKQPYLRYFTSNRLYKKQLYHLEFKEEKCILYAQGQKTLSELLLRNGLAFVKPFFNNPEFYHSFINAQNNARMEELGMWSEELIINCMASIYKE